MLQRHDFTVYLEKYYVVIYSGNSDYDTDEH